METREKEELKKKIDKLFSEYKLFGEIQHYLITDFEGPKEKEDRFRGLIGETKQSREIEIRDFYKKAIHSGFFTVRELLEISEGLGTFLCESILDYKFKREN